jgi:phenylalanyl-tRNA synthetase alpha chain
VGRPEIEALLKQFESDLDGARSLQALDDARRAHTGKKSPLKSLLGKVKDLAPEDRAVFARDVNDAQARIESALEARKAELAQAELDQQLDREWLDLTLPGLAHPRGAKHPLTEVEGRCVEMLRQLGFEVKDGPEVELPYYNFDALNIPEHHPARDMQDTFYVGDATGHEGPKGPLVLRTHTTSIQARVLAEKPPLPVRVIAPGRVYRNEAVDASHLACFHQFDCIWVDVGLTFGHLKGLLSFLCRSIYGERARIRFKPKYYPYTEPSVGVDLAREVRGTDGRIETVWVTILGAGMVHPKVLQGFGYDPESVSGIAFGLGTTRMAAERHAIPYLKALYEGDLRLFEALHRGSSS